jgi:hypothetical protein
MLNSSNYQLQEGVLNSGEQLAPDFDLRDPEVKIYYHQTRGARTHMPDGTEITFTGGMFATKIPEVKAYLDRIADKQGTMVYTRPEAEARIKRDVATVQADARAPAGDAKKLGEGEKAELTPMHNPLDNSGPLEEVNRPGKVLDMTPSQDPKAETHVLKDTPAVTPTAPKTLVDLVQPKK